MTWRAGLNPEFFALPADGGATDAQAVFHEHGDEAGIFNGTVVFVRQAVVRREGVAM